LTNEWYSEWYLEVSEKIGQLKIVASDGKDIQLSPIWGQLKLEIESGGKVITEENYLVAAQNRKKIKN